MRLPLAFTLISLSLAACGGDDSTTMPDAPAAKDVGFNPPTMTLQANMDGSDGPSAQSARAFARNWAGSRDLPLILQDERLSTSAVTRTLLEADASRRRRSDVVDKMAAAYILQGALDRLRNLR